jgi:hypothetical protein
MKIVFALFSIFGLVTAIYTALKVIALQSVTCMEMVLYFLLFCLSLAVLGIGIVNYMEGGAK